jgi:hypothetical protein
MPAAMALNIAVMVVSLSQIEPLTENEILRDRELERAIA